jgi:hypothetical protein
MRLTIRQENELEKLIIRMAKLTEPVTKEYVRDMAKTMLEPEDKRPLGVRWVDSFLLRHPALAFYSAVRRDEEPTFVIWLPSSPGTRDLKRLLENFR